MYSIFSPFSFISIGEHRLAHLSPLVWTNISFYAPSNSSQPHPTLHTHCTPPAFPPLHFTLHHLSLIPPSYLTNVRWLDWNDWLRMNPTDSSRDPSWCVLPQLQVDCLVNVYLHVCAHMQTLTYTSLIRKAEWANFHMLQVLFQIQK